MRSHDVFSDNMVDLYISRVLKHWVQDVPLPSDGRAELLNAASNENFPSGLTFKSLLVVFQQVLIEFLTSSIAPTAQPMIYSIDVSGADYSRYYAEYVDQSSQFHDELSFSMGAGFLALVA